jgi:hypothetical protein
MAVHVADSTDCEHMGNPAISERPTLAPGTRVEVRSRFRRDWVRGFEVAAPDGGGYRLRRLSDRFILPVVFAHTDIRLTGSGLARPAPARLRIR